MTTTLRRKRRDMSQCVMSVLECLKDQQYEGGVMKQDLMYRCGLNFHYMEQIMNYLIVNELIHKSSTQPSYRKNSFRYYLTEKGFKFWADLGQHLEPVVEYPMVPVLIMNGILAHVSLKSRTAGAAREDANRTSNKGLTKAAVEFII